MAKNAGSARLPSQTDRKAAADAASAGRLRQIRLVAGIIRKSNPKALPIVFGAGIGVIVVFVLVGLLTGLAALLIPLGVMLGILATTILFGRFAQAAQYSAIEGQPGAAVAIVQSMRGNWTATAAVAANRNLDVVHRVVGKPGVILIGEGSPNGLAPLLGSEKRKIARIAYGVPITELQVGDEPGQTSIRALQRKLLRMPRALKPAKVRELNERLKALPASLQAPRGPLPTRGRMPRPPRPRAR